jgi:AAA15 family ATPase/GTPase
MFKTITIKNYRALSNLQLSNLSRINILMGENNCGKSTFLESVFLLTGLSRLELLLRCNDIRDYSKIKDFSYFFHNLDTSKEIEINSYSDGNTNFNRELKIQKVASSQVTISPESIQSDAVSSNDGFSESVRFTAKVNNQNIEASYETQLKSVPGGEKPLVETGKVTKDKDYRESIFCQYVSPKNSFNTALEYAKKIQEEKKEAEIIESLKMLDSRISNFSIIDEDIFIDVELNKRIPINFWGDGTRKFFSILVSLYKCQNSVLLIDEIDNGLHFSAMQNLWHSVQAMAQKYNVQLFITTHNIDSLNALKHSFEKNESLENDFSFYKLIQKVDGSNLALRYSGKEVRNLLELENEIR